MMLNKRFVFILIFFMAMRSGSVGADSANGKNLFDKKGCDNCHYTQGPARETGIADQLRKKGPELWYAGSKFNRAWLENWLGNPKPIRPMAYNSLTEKNAGDHPVLSAQEAVHVSDYLMGLKSDAVETGLIEPNNNPRGRLVFSKKMPCFGCHKYPMRRGVTGGLTGPSLVGAKQRLNSDWIYAYMMNPDVFKPVKMMPVFTGILNEKEMKSVSAYVADFE